MLIFGFRGTYPIKAMREVFEVSRSGYYAWHKVQKKMPKDQWLVDPVSYTHLTLPTT